MATDKTIRVAIIGLGFGAEFIPIYQKYPGAEVHAICRRSRKDLDECGDRWKSRRPATTRVRGSLSTTPTIDAVHINSPIQDHARQSIAALEAGKHVACTVPMATTIEECGQIVAAQRKSGKVYMMMETVVYSREYLFVKNLYDKGRTRPDSVPSRARISKTWPVGRATGRVCLPMYYATHCVSPCLALLGKHAEHVVCHGSGRIDEALIPKYNSPYRDRDSHVQDQGQRRLRRGHAKPVRHREAVSRELRRLREQEELSSGSRSRGKNR